MTLLESGPRPFLPSSATASSSRRARRVGVVLGTRPEGVKLAPVVTALADAHGYEPVVISTGQHREMLREILGGFGIAPAVDLDLMRPGQSLSDLAGRAVGEIGAALERLAIDAVIVQGDTTTTLAGAMAAFYRGLPVVHLEAGLRTHDRYAPFPEEVNRRAVTQFADLHLTPTARATAALLAEGVTAASIVQTGNTVVDALLATVARDLPYAGAQADVLRRVEDGEQRVVLVTAHRRESWGHGLDQIAAAVAAVVRERPDVVAVVPMHVNPVVRASLEPVLGALPGVVLTEPLGYADFVRMLRRCDLVVTDSGGIQEEACSLGKPTLVTRDTTERPEGAEAGGLRLVGTRASRIRDAVTELLDDPDAYRRLVCTTMPFGDGTAAVRAVEALALLDIDRRDAAHAAPSRRTQEVTA